MTHDKESLWFAQTQKILFQVTGVLTCFYFCQAAGFPEPEIIHYNPKEFDFGKKKAFPFRDQVHVEI